MGKFENSGNLSLLQLTFHSTFQAKLFHQINQIPLNPQSHFQNPAVLLFIIIYSYPYLNFLLYIHALLFIIINHDKKNYVIHHVVKISFTVIYNKIIIFFNFNDILWINDL